MMNGHYNMERDTLVRLYFDLGFNQNEMLYFLATKHRIVISKRHLKRILKGLRLYRRKHSDIVEVAIFLLDNLRTSCQLHGYRWMHSKCLANGFRVSQHTIRLLLHILDQDAVNQRRRRRLQRRKYRGVGPNFTWHIDSYDKLKPYGICINGCIDGFSRKIIWLQAHHTSSDPRLIAGYFMKADLEEEGCPRRVRADRGTENGTVKELQTFLRRNHQDDLADLKSFVYGRSIANQRIEAWWGILRKEFTQFWMNTFAEMKDNDKFSGDFLDKNLIQVCFMAILQKELNGVVNTWDCHRLQHQRNMVEPSGKPIIMYTSPELYQTENKLVPVNALDVEVCVEQCVFKDGRPCGDSTVFELCCDLMVEHGLDVPQDVQEAVLLYNTLRDAIYREL